MAQESSSEHPLTGSLLDPSVVDGTTSLWAVEPAPHHGSPNPPALQSLLDLDLPAVTAPRPVEPPWTTSISGTGQTVAALLNSPSESPDMSTSSAGKVLAAATAVTHQHHSGSSHAGAVGSRPSPGLVRERSSLQASVTSLEGECNLIVAGLTREIDDEALKAMFSPFGQVMSSTVMRHVGTGVSRGFGFVLFAREQDGEAAVKAMHSSRCGPNVLNVHRSVHDGTIVETNAVFVRNLPLDVTPDRVAAFFSVVGPATSITIASDTSKDAGDAPNGRRYKVATVIFNDVETARDAVKTCHNKPFSVSDPTVEDPPLVIVKFAESAETRRTKRKTPNLATANARSSTSPSGASAAHHGRSTGHGSSSTPSAVPAAHQTPPQGWQPAGPVSYVAIPAQAQPQPQVHQALNGSATLFPFQQPIATNPAFAAPSAAGGFPFPAYGAMNASPTFNTSVGGGAMQQQQQPQPFHLAQVPPGYAVVTHPNGMQMLVPQQQTMMQQQQQQPQVGSTMPQPPHAFVSHPQQQQQQQLMFAAMPGQPQPQPQQQQVQYHQFQPPYQLQPAPFQFNHGAVGAASPQQQQQPPVAAQTYLWPAQQQHQHQQQAVPQQWAFAPAPHP